jgi:hypothetical protein
VGQFDFKLTHYPVSSILLKGSLSLFAPLTRFHHLSTPDLMAPFVLPAETGPALCRPVQKAGY